MGKKCCYEICKCSKEHEFCIENTEQLLTLLNMYLTDWIHRDSLFWKQIFAYFLSVLVVIILPFAENLGVDFGSLIPKYIFPIIGIAMTSVFLLVGKGYILRVKASRDSVQKLMDMLPEDYRRTRLEDISTTDLLNASMAEFVLYTMSVALFSLGTILLYLTLTN